MTLFIELVLFLFSNQVMRKKLILFFKRRNHARKQRVRAGLLWKVLYSESFISSLFINICSIDKHIKHLFS